jgi:hypothetical protein
MSDFIIHAEMMLLFCIVFAIGTFIWDFDHVIKCKPKLLMGKALNPGDIKYDIENMNQNGCRGFTHDLAFGVAFAALFAGYIVHMIMDRVGYGL